MLADAPHPSDSSGQSKPLGSGCLLAPIADSDTRTKAAAVGHAVAAELGEPLYVVRSDTDDSGSPLPPDHRFVSHADPVVDVAGDRIETLVDSHDVRTVVMERSEDGLLGELFTDDGSRVAAATNSQVLTVNSTGTFDTVASILVPVANGPHTPLAIETARAFARANDAVVDLFHVVTDETQRATGRGEQLLATAADRFGGGENVDTWLYRADSVADAIVEQSTYYDATILGAPTSGRLQRFVFGSTSKNVQETAASPVVVAHSRPEQ
ncbi:universal stress protein [Haloferacaceae archaeon DSL9]